MAGAVLNWTVVLLKNGSAKLKVCASKSATFAKPRTVVGNPLATVLTLTWLQEMNDRTISAKPCLLFFAKAKEKQRNRTSQRFSCFTFAFAPQHKDRYIWDMTIVKEFIDALAIEIDALKKGKGGSIVTVYNGELIRQTLDLFIYQFTLENFLITLDDTPANIEVNGKEYECNIISVTGQQVQLSINQKLSERIPVAKIKTNTWYLLERLKKEIWGQSKHIKSIWKQQQIISRPEFQNWRWKFQHFLFT